MSRKLIALIGLVALGACGSGAPDAESAEGASTASVNDRFAGAWSLVRIERFDADGELLAPPIEDRVGLIAYDATGHMAVGIMQPNREQVPASERTPLQTLATYSTYTSYFGPYTVDEAEGSVTHHLEGSLNANATRTDYKRFYTFEGNNLVLQPPPAANGNYSQLTWERLPDLPESELTETHKQLFGFYRIESVSRGVVGGDETLPVNQYETAFILYTPSGHMAAHLMRPGRERYAGAQPTPEEALAAMSTYGGYFGPFSVNEEGGYLLHHRIGSLSPGGVGVDAQRWYTLTDTHLTLRPPANADSQGRQLQTALRWRRISD